MCQNPKKKKLVSAFSPQSNISNHHANWPWTVDHIVARAANCHIGRTIAPR